MNNAVAIRSALGAKVRVSAGGRSQSAEVRSGGSSLSQSDLRLHFGLGGAARVDHVEIGWPSGAKQAVHDVAPNQPLSQVESMEQVISE